MVAFDYVSKNPLIEHPNQTITMEFEYGKVFNPFSTNVPLLYSLKTSENGRLSDVFRGYRSGTLVENGLINYSFCLT